jgi:hypothetical protein
MPGDVAVAIVVKNRRLAPIRTVSPYPDSEPQSDQ